MSYPSFMQAFPGLDIPFSEELVTSKAIQSEDGLVVFFEFHQDMEIPPHAHKAQWGTVVEGSVELTIDGKTRVYGPGESYSIGDGVEHGAKVKAGSKVIDVFEENDRYPLRR